MAPAMTMNTENVVAKCTALAAEALKLPARSMWIDYDKDADVLYISFRRPQRAQKTIEREDGILVRKDGRTIVGVTIPHASTRA